MSKVYRTQAWQCRIHIYNEKDEPDVSEFRPSYSYIERHYVEKEKDRNKGKQSQKWKQKQSKIDKQLKVQNSYLAMCFL